MNNFWLQVNPVFPWWEVASVLFPVFAYFLWKEVNRVGRFLVARIVAQVLIFISILGFLLRPLYLGKGTAFESVLLTSGYDKSKVDSLLQVNPSLKIFHLPKVESYRESKSAPPYFTLTESGNAIRFILGEGLPGYALNLIDEKNFNFIPGNIPIGITQLDIPNTPQVNHLTLLQGLFNAEGSTKLTLSGPAGVEDSTILTGTGQARFALRFKPKQAGHFVYTLTTTSLSKEQTVEKLPINVYPERKLRILFLQKFPTAEVRYLKNYLAEKGHALALRYQISKNNFKYEYANLSSTRFDHLTPPLAASFDLIFIDNNVLAELSPAESTVLEKSIREGLGVVLLFNSSVVNRNKFNLFFPLATKSLIVDTVHIRFSNSKPYVLPAPPMEIIYDASLQPVTKSKNRVLSGYRYHGFGKVAFQLLQETYRISLAGNSDDYGSVWSSLVERTARSTNEMFELKIENPSPFYPDEPVDVEVISSGQQPTLTADGNALPLTEDLVLDDYWHGQSWADKPGWHQFFVKQDSSHLDYFVFAQGEWNALRVTNQMKENELAQSPNPGRSSREKKEATVVPPLLFYLIFLFSAGFLWLAPKL